jgi:hypothetical protein
MAPSANRKNWAPGLVRLGEHSLPALASARALVTGAAADMMPALAGSLVSLNAIASPAARVPAAGGAGLTPLEQGCFGKRRTIRDE